MMIFHSYVSLPEGNMWRVVIQNSALGHLRGTTRGSVICSALKDLCCCDQHETLGIATWLVPPFFLVDVCLFHDI